MQTRAYPARVCFLCVIGGSRPILTLMDPRRFEARLALLTPLARCAEVVRLPREPRLIEAIEALRALVFPELFESRGDQSSPDRVVVAGFAELIDEAFLACGQQPNPTVTDQFLATVPTVAHMLGRDVHAAFRGDPAAHNTLEIVVCYPGIRALLVHRFAHTLDRLGVPLLPRMMAEHAHRETGIDIHPSAQIGEELFIDHGTGVVIGQTAVIGARCRIYQGVTLGAKSFDREPDGSLRRGYKRHPTLEDDVTVYAGATILGGDTVIGRGSVVAGGVFLTKSVPPGHVVTGPKLELRMISMGGAI
jgi:serine O-acetyltransferase